MSERKSELEELEMIRKLMIVGLIRLGLTQDELGSALGIHGTTIGRMFPKGLLKDIAKKG
ncbi:hypothetical protein P7228_12610 [Altererythrobacter arenosus]|uniref:Helix-turn-helix domain-containing protein n=1 Tax=Altererythrobacter arenosus TaxID=3032592 RepID=A0ABY8FTW2_9SPHN|nr:hypothetical protein [Altererythrobacter sp. CAU 1644]WFL76831.1 hypothetical protein P7228_12610 [Altererythrobacter sp. CAU 1644]